MSGDKQQQPDGFVLSDGVSKRADEAFAPATEGKKYAFYKCSDCEVPAFYDPAQAQQGFPNYGAILVEGDSKRWVCPSCVKARETGVISSADRWVWMRRKGKI